MSSTTQVPIEWAPIDDSIPPNAHGGFDGPDDGLDDPVFDVLAPLPPSPEPPPAEDRTWPTAASVIARMRSFLDIAENPPGSNCNDLTKWYGAGCVFWCAITVSKACFDAGFNDGNDNWSMPGITPQKRRRGFAGVALMKEAFVAAKRFDHTPQVGDIFVLGNCEHTGLIEDISHGVLHTIEGNWGDKCVRNSRTATAQNLTGFCRPPYGDGGIFAMLTDAEQAELLQKTRELYKFFTEPVLDVGAGVPWAVAQTLLIAEGVRDDVATIKSKLPT